MPTFLYRMKIDHLSSLTRRMVGGGRLLVPEILGQTDPIAFENLMFSLYLLVVP